MSVGSVDNTIQQQNPYANKVAKPQDEEAEGKVEGTGKTEPSKPSQPQGSQDEYIPSSDKQEKNSGVYRLEKDKNGNSKVTVDQPAEAEEQAESQVESEKASKTAEEAQTGGNKPMKSGGAPKSDDEETSSTTTNTDSVDAEIEKLKKRKAQLQKQLQNNQGDENHRKNVEKQLAQLNAEIILKDSDAYRKQNATYSS